MKTIGTTLILLILLGLSGVSAQDHGHGHNAMKADKVHDHSLFHLQSNWTDHRGDNYQIGDFEGKPLIVVMFYGTCVEVCPILIQDTWRLYNEIEQTIREDVHVLAVTFDPENDTPEVLYEYAVSQQLDIPGWHFMTGGRSAIRELAMMLGVRFRERSDGDFEHSNLISVLDTEGLVVERLEGLGQPIDHAGQKIMEIVQKGVMP